MATGSGSAGSALRGADTHRAPRVAPRWAPTSSRRQPQREANLRDALDEYLRLGLTAGLHYAN